jgi:photosystem II stability/assembly factor-like uncharacterized protein
MKTIGILLIALILNASCQETKTAALTPKNGGGDNLTKTRETPRISFKRNGENKCGLFDFVLSNENSLIGFGLGSRIGTASANKQNGSEVRATRNIFVCSSEDRGKSWSGESGIPYENIGPISSIAENEQEVYIGGEDGSIWEKRGMTWQAIYEPKVNGCSFRQIDLSNNGVGFAACETKYGAQIFKTQNDGKTWQKVYENEISGHAFDLLVVDENVAIVAVNDDYVLRTEDGGKSWRPQELENTGRIVNDKDWIDLKDNGASALTLAPGGIVWITGKNGSLYYSDDEGETWKRPDKMPGSIQQQELKSIAFSTSGRGIVVGKKGYIIISEDNGKTWNEIPQTLLVKSISENDNPNLPDTLLKVRFSGENAIILGLLGVYEVSF